MAEGRSQSLLTRLQKGTLAASEVVRGRSVLALREDDTWQEAGALPVEYGHLWSAGGGGTTAPSVLFQLRNQECLN